MQRFIKTKVLRLLDTLMQANTLIEGYVSMDNRESALLLLEDEQQAVARIQEIIEESEGEGHETAALLKEYNHLLCQCSAREGKGRIEGVRKLGGSVSRIRDRIQETVPTKYDVVFLSYKASMWDSLESVWLAAKEDADCNCYVISVPYFDKKPDGSLGEIHDEGDQYPDYVPITSYQEYNIESRHPEVVFIHYPYDQYNRVTSIHPVFYSSNLVNHTDLLVYIPYFISGADVREHYCTTPGVLNSNLVVLQSGQVRDTYLRVLRQEFHLTDEEARAVGLHKKILALGSPKIDKVINMRSEDIVLPKEWEKKIYGTD